MSNSTELENNGRSAINLCENEFSGILKFCEIKSDPRKVGYGDAVDVVFRHPC